MVIYTRCGILSNDGKGYADGQTGILEKRGGAGGIRCGGEAGRCRSDRNDSNGGRQIPAGNEAALPQDRHHTASAGLRPPYSQPGKHTFTFRPRISYRRTSLVAQTVKRLSTMWETWVRSLGREDPLEKEMAVHSSTIAWKIPWTEEPGRL